MRAIDLTGKTFGRLTVLGRAENRGEKRQWRCVCECGSESVVSGSGLTTGSSRSCGCFRRDKAATIGAVSNLRHGLCKTPEYATVVAARKRCRYPKARGYERYGGRGIEYRLPEDFGEAVAALVAAIGLRPPGMSLDRIDNDGHYEIGNLRWATATEQQRNRRYSVAA